MTGTMIKTAIAFLMLLVTQGLTAGAATVTPVPLTPGVTPSSVYHLKVDGKDVPVGVETSAGRTFHIAAFCMAGEAAVQITLAGELSEFSIHPKRLSIPARRDGQALTFNLAEPRKLMVKVKGQDPLVLVATPPETDIPDPKDPKVHYYGPGTHRVGRLKVKSGETVYLAGGARFIGAIDGEEVENVRVMGRGILDGAEHTNWQKRIYGLVFDRSKNITIEGIGIRNCYWWTTEFLLCQNVDISHINIFTFNRNNGGIMTDGCTDFFCHDSILITRDDCICPHALNAAGNGEPSSTYRFEDCVLYNVTDGNAIRIGASFETREVCNWTFRRIDVLARAGAAIYSDHSDWAIVRNLRFIDFTDEQGTKNTIDVKIVKNNYSCKTGYRDERGNFDGLYFVNFQATGGGVKLTGFDATHKVDHVYFYNCKVGDKLLSSLGDIGVNDFVTNVRFVTNGSLPPPLTVKPAGPAGVTSPAELILDNQSEGFRAVGFEYKSDKESAHGKDVHVASVPEGFSNFKAAIYEPRIQGQYDVFIHWGDFTGKAANACWSVRHAAGYSTKYLNQNSTPGWHLHGRYRLDGASSVRLALPGYFSIADNPVVADAVKFVKVNGY